MDKIFSYDKKYFDKKKNLKKIPEFIKMLKNANKKEPIFCCKTCDFSTSHKPNYDRHILTIKHLSVTNANKMLTKKNVNEPHYLCSCGKSYKHKPSLLRHKKVCNYEPETGDIFLTEYHKMDVIIKQNQEFKEMLMEQNKENRILQEKILKMNSHTTVVNQVNQFNLNFFLNETCKEAISITEFIKSLPIGITDLEYLGRNGYVQGISNIFLNGLRKLDITKRPIHCSDSKRETLYIKDNNAWEKDKEKVKITQAIKIIAQTNIRQIPVWTNKNPTHNDLKSDKNTDYLNIIKESVAGEEENQKIIKLISREIVIEK